MLPLMKVGFEAKKQLGMKMHEPAKVWKSFGSWYYHPKMSPWTKIMSDHKNTGKGGANPVRT